MLLSIIYGKLIVRVNEYSVWQTLKYTFPLILSSLSVNLMFITDRMVLGYYSINAMNAATITGNIVTLVSFFLISITHIATVFVGQYNGLGAFKKMSAPVWQMIYFSIMAFFVFMPYAYFTEELSFIPKCYEAEGLPYQKILMYAAAFPALNAALASFFIGKGEGKVVTYVVIIGNIINLVLNIILVFGVKSWFEPMGAKGAAISTVVCEISQVIILCFRFFSKRNRIQYDTLNHSFNYTLFKNCIKTGIPVAMGKFLTFLVWYIMFLCLSFVSNDLATIESIMISLFVTFIFFSDGCAKAISSMSAYFIGENNIIAVQKIYKIFMKFNVVMCCIFAIPLVFYHDILLYFISFANGEIMHLRSEFIFVFYSLWIIIFLDGIFYITSGVLAAGGDTKFSMYLEVITSWLIVLLPTVYMFWSDTLSSIREIYVLIPIGCLINAVITYKRYKSLKWYKKLV